MRPIRLQVQYRMHPALSEFPSVTFYEGSLQNGVLEHERSRKGVDFPWPNPQVPMMFWNTHGVEEYSASGTSFLNRTEGACCEKAVAHLVKSGVKASQIGVITPYEGQRAHVTALLQRSSSLTMDMLSDLEVASVDSFQGREKDYIILSCVRASATAGIGFLKDARRLNVALTRAKYGLVLIGSAKILCKQQPWLNLLHHFQKHDVIVEGALNGLKSSFIRLPRAHKVINQNRFVASDLHLQMPIADQPGEIPSAEPEIVDDQALADGEGEYGPTTSASLNEVLGFTPADTPTETSLSALINNSQAAPLTQSQTMVHSLTLTQTQEPQMDDIALHMDSENISRPMY
eukprot:TRINITY_DN1755_c1_g1_i1.p1 TRINITY_DN1755_c1_g1~~TRINITY_DN1755_c1_g1_i1.p1  ORF type:complete len:346 (-),score=72.10 TRINITY_DN1755_c1_g1_i1:79-1116(-)